MLIQEILEDKEFKKVTIDVYFFSSAILDPFEFFAYKKKIIGSHTHTGSLFKISFEEELPKKLLGELAWGRSEEFIIGYISKYLPRVNEELLNQRYSTGHLLIKTFSTLDISKVDIHIHSSQEGNIFLNWPQMIGDMPPARQLASQMLQPRWFDLPSLAVGDTSVDSDRLHSRQSSLGLQICLSMKSLSNFQKGKE